MPSTCPHCGCVLGPTDADACPACGQPLGEKSPPKTAIVSAPSTFPSAAQTREGIQQPSESYPSYADSVAGANEDRVPDISLPPSNTVAYVMLAIPILAGFFFWQWERLGLRDEATWVSIGCVISTAVLGFVDLRLLANRRPEEPTDGRPAPRPGAMLAGMLLLWIVFYPLHMYARRRLGGRNLLFPGLVATSIYVAAAFSPLFSAASLPSVQSREVIGLVKQILNDDPVIQANRHRLGELVMQDPVEVGFDAELQRRVGRATLVTRLGQAPLTYFVEWQNRATGMFQVTIAAADLPWLNDRK